MGTYLDITSIDIMGTIDYNIIINRTAKAKVDGSTERENKNTT